MNISNILLVNCAVSSSNSSQNISSVYSSTHSWMTHTKQNVSRLCVSMTP